MPRRPKRPSLPPATSVQELPPHSTANTETSPARHPSQDTHSGKIANDAIEPGSSEHRGREQDILERTFGDGAPRARTTAPMQALDESPSFGGLVFVLLLALMFVLGVGAYTLIGWPTLSVGRSASSSPTAVVADPTTDSIMIGIDEGRAQLIADLAMAFSETTLVDDLSRQIEFTSRDGDDQREASSREILAVVSGSLPPSLTRSLDSDLHYQIRLGRTLEGTLMIPVRSDDHALAALLAWEKDMGVGLAQFLDPIGTTRKEAVDLWGTPFVDVRLESGHDARVLYTFTNAPALSYLIASSTLVVTVRPETLTRILTHDSNKEHDPSR